MPVDIEKIKELRKERGLTQEEAAAAAGLSSKQSWNAIERGRQTDITISLLERIAAALKVKPADLLKQQ